MSSSRIDRVAVVGASSQIGQALLPLLAASELVVYRIGRANRGADEAQTYVFDPTAQSFTPPLGSVDAVISLAPLPLINVVLEMAGMLGARRVIAFGSTGRFSKLDSTSAIERDFVAQQERAEKLFMVRSEGSGIGWTLFRPTMIYGVDADLNVAFIRAMIRKFGVFPMPIGANGLRQPVHVGDLAAACVSALGNENTLNRAYNLGGGETLTFPDLVRRVFEAEGMRPRLVPIPLWVFRLVVAAAKRLPQAAFVRMEMVERMFKDLTVDNAAAMNDFGYKPRAFFLAALRAQ
jgi:nucleoside-diphosphate-sugar epimerase